VSLVAQISTYQDTRDERTATRRLLRLHVPASASGNAAPALVHNVSERGLLLETAMLLQVGDVLVVELPEAGATAAEVIWARDGFAGCEFETPISKAAISAGLLQSPPKAAPPTFAPSQPHAANADSLYEPDAYTEDETLVRALTIGSLLVALVVATIFIIALLSFPFSTE
jgi:hypothetical protein